jgi:hypothetical protein
MKDEKIWYQDQRAEALAIVYLTRRQDLVVHQQKEDYGYDLLVEITRDSRLTKRVFAIQIKSKTEPIKVQKLIGVTFDEWRETPFPLCLFFFTMRNDHAYYTWITEPIVTQDNRPKLRLNTEAHLFELDTLALDTIVAQVNHWYDSLFKELAA